MRLSESTPMLILTKSSKRTEPIRWRAILKLTTAKMLNEDSKIWLELITNYSKKKVINRRTIMERTCQLEACLRISILKSINSIRLKQVRSLLLNLVKLRPFPKKRRKRNLKVNFKRKMKPKPMSSSILKQVLPKQNHPQLNLHHQVQETFWKELNSTQSQAISNLSTDRENSESLECTKKTEKASK